MARRSVAVAVALAVIAGCGPLQGFDGTPPPLAAFTVVADTTDAAAPLARPHVAIVWGMEWQTEALCIAPPESAVVAGVLVRGCRDPFGFVPLRVAASAPVTPGEPTTIVLDALPAADELVGTTNGRIAYASFVLFDDLDGDGTLRLARPSWLAVSPEESIASTPVKLGDAIYGASFATMLAPDQRVAYREGGYDSTNAYYPRHGCDAPPLGFSIASDGGLSTEFTGGDYALLLQAVEAGFVPDQISCDTGTPHDTTVTVAARAPVIEVPDAPLVPIQEVACIDAHSDSTVTYREPPVMAPDMSNRFAACVHLPTLDSSSQSTVVELIVSGHPDDSCAGVTHFILSGCADNPYCSNAEWNDGPPSWWPCPAS